jgi:hypothetical protein
MRRCYQSTTGRCAAKGPNCRPLANEEKSGAFSTGSWIDTSPPNGCRTATKVAVWELAENPIAYRESFPTERRAVTNGSRMGTC